MNKNGNGTVEQVHRSEYTCSLFPHHLSPAIAHRSPIRGLLPLLPRSQNSGGAAAAAAAAAASFFFNRKERDLPFPSAPTAGTRPTSYMDDFFCCCGYLRALRCNDISHTLLRVQRGRNSGLQNLPKLRPKCWKFIATAQYLHTLKLLDCNSFSVPSGCALPSRCLTKCSN